MVPWSTYIQAARKFVISILHFLEFNISKFIPQKFFVLCAFYSKYISIRVKKLQPISGPVNPQREKNFYRGEKYISNRWKTFSFLVLCKVDGNKKK